MFCGSNKKQLAILFVFWLVLLWFHDAFHYGYNKQLWKPALVQVCFMAMIVEPHQCTAADHSSHDCSQPFPQGCRVFFGERSSAVRRMVEISAAWRMGEGCCWILCDVCWKISINIDGIPLAVQVYPSKHFATLLAFCDCVKSGWYYVATCC